MLVFLSEYFAQYFSGFHVFQYITLRAILSLITAFVISLAFGRPVINYLTRLKLGQSVRTLGPETHYVKEGTPTMGGMLILVAATLAVLLWANWSNHYVWVVLFVTLTFGAIGWWDDYKKIVYKSSDGLAAKWKFLGQSLFATIALVWLYLCADDPVMTTLYLPFIKSFSFPLGIGFVILGYFVIVGASNAVNLTDGLDGLAILPICLVAGGLGIFAYASGHLEFAHYLALPHIEGAGEVVIVCAAIAGAGLGFLWFNAYPAEVFMGDVGALALGAALGTISVIIRQEVVFFIMGGLFVLETLSVIIQVGSYKLRGKRVFKMAPIHHHFELAGWPEPKVIIRFWIIAFILVLLGLATLKLR